VEAHEESADELLCKARDLEDALIFEDAYRLYLLAADAFHEQPSADGPAEASSEAFALMRAGHCLEMLQPWRTHTAIWERLGNLLGNSIDHSLPFRTPKTEGQHNLYHIISYTEWLEGLQDADDLARLSWKRQQQAWAYSWAAEEAEANNRYVLAARLYRKAGAAWTVNAQSTPERGRMDGLAPLGSRDPEHRNLLELSGPWLEGARCFYKASLCAQASGDAESLSRVIEPWAPAENEWGRTADESITVTGAYSDLERLSECWENYLGLSRNGVPYAASASRQVSGLLDFARQLFDIQRGYARTGERKQAIMVYRLRQRILDKASLLAGCYIGFALRKLYWWTTGSGSSIARAFATAGIAYLLAFPIMFYTWSRLGLSNSRLHPNFADAIVLASATSSRTQAPDT
jgi:hypothetical protein